MQKKNNNQTGMMVQRCHRWRQKRKQLIEQARQTNDEIERERLLQSAEHYGRIVNDEQSKIDSKRGPRFADHETAPESIDSDDEDFQDFKSN